LTCTVVAPAVVGSDLFNVTAYDAQQTSSSPATPAGQILSQGAVTVTVAANQANVAPPLILNGVATAIVLTPPAGDPHVLGTQNTGYRIIGNQPYIFTVAARDAGGNLIIDPGAPSFTVQAGADALIVAPVSGTTNAYAVRARRFSSIPVIVTITASNSSAFTNVAFTTIQELWVANAYNSTITAYAGQPPVQIVADTITRSSGLLGPTGIAFDDYGRMWVSNFYNVTMFAGSTTAPADTITAGLTRPSALAFDSGGILWVADWGLSGPGTVNSYAGTSQMPGTITNPDSSMTGLWGPRYLAFDAAGNLWVANNGGSVRTVTAYSGTTQLTGSTITGVVGPWGLALDGSGALWVASSYPASTINPYSGSTLIYGNTITSAVNQPAGIAFDGSGNLWVANNGNNTVTAYAGTSQLTGNTITAGISGPIGLTFAPPATLPVNPPPPHPSPPPAPVVADPSSVAFSTVGSGFQRVTVSQAGYFGDWSMTNSNSSVASADQSGAAIIVRPLAVGTTVLRMTNTPGQFVDIPVTVSTSGNVVVSPSSLAFTNIGTTFNQSVALSQAGYSGPFSSFIFDSTVVGASISGNILTVTPLSSGSTVVRVGGGNSQFADVSVGVTVSNVIIHAARRGAR
jgi:sugar lactone lactonase YvrE